MRAGVAVAWLVVLSACCGGDRGRDGSAVAFRICRSGGATVCLVVSRTWRRGTGHDGLPVVLRICRGEGRGRDGLGGCVGEPAAARAGDHNGLAGSCTPVGRRSSWPWNPSAVRCSRADSAAKRIEQLCVIQPRKAAETKCASRPETMPDRARTPRESPSRRAPEATSPAAQKETRGTPTKRRPPHHNPLNRPEAISPKWTSTRPARRRRSRVPLRSGVCRRRSRWPCRSRTRSRSAATFPASGT